jgi:RNA polymerase sigma-70 factor (ECF subfamily)
MTDATAPSGYPAGRFATTRWSMVVSAGQTGTSRSRESLAQLCELYWRPVYAYVRKRGESPEEARDLTQEFFTTLLEKNYVASADPSRGRFRSFLLASVQHFLLNAWDRKHAQKRGGWVRHESLDVDPEESFIHFEPSTHETPERIFEHRWAVALVERVIEGLRAEQARAGKAETFEVLLPLMCSERQEHSYEEMSASTGSTPGAMRVAVHRLRRRFRALLVAEIAGTVSDPSQVDDELNYLLTVLQDPEERR